MNVDLFQQNYQDCLIGLDERLKGYLYLPILMALYSQQRRNDKTARGGGGHAYRFQGALLPMLPIILLPI